MISLPPIRRKWTIVLALYLFMGLACQFGWTGSDWARSQPGLESQPPSAEAWFGTDHLGRDLFSQTLQGIRIALGVGLLAAGGAVALGTLLGLASGYYRGPVDGLVLWLSSAVAAIPGILLVLAIASAMGPGFLSLCVAFAAVSWIGIYRLIRAETLRLVQQDFVLASRANGASTSRVLWCHLLPNLWPIIAVQFCLAFIYAIQAEAILSFLGVGLIETPSWGRMIADAWAWNDLGQGRWWRMTSATLALAGLALAVQKFLAPSSESARRR
jgi:ABC-type dipeptide/oligopeptide/nickel transport system permease subunit